MGELLYVHPHNNSLRYSYPHFIDEEKVQKKYINCPRSQIGSWKDGAGTQCYWTVHPTSPTLPKLQASTFPENNCLLAWMSVVEMPVLMCSRAQHNSGHTHNSDHTLVSPADSHSILYKSCKPSSSVSPDVQGEIKRVRQWRAIWLTGHLLFRGVGWRWGWEGDTGAQT